MRATNDARPGVGSHRSIVDARPLDVGLQHVGVAGLLTRLGGAVVDALVADQRLQQLDRRLR